MPSVKHRSAVGVMCDRVDCEILDACAGADCGNGSCNGNTDGSPICNCADGYSGARCEINAADGNQDALESESVDDGNQDPDNLNALKATSASDADAATGDLLNSQDDASEVTESGVIIGVIVGVIILVLIGVGICLLKKSKKNTEEEPSEQVTSIPMSSLNQGQPRAPEPFPDPPRDFTVPGALPNTYPIPGPPRGYGGPETLPVVPDAIPGPSMGYSNDDVQFQAQFQLQRSASGYWTLDGMRVPDGAAEAELTEQRNQLGELFDGRMNIRGKVYEFHDNNQYSGQMLNRLEGEGETWICSTCTLENPSTATRCKICSSLMPSAASHL